MGTKTATYRDESQMGMEDLDVDGSAVTLTRYSLGARGIDPIEQTTSSGTVTGFPIYDAHGTNMGTLTRNGSGGFNVGDRRTYEAWGLVRTSQSSGAPTVRYCGNLGHKADDESTLIEMWAEALCSSSIIRFKDWR